MDAETFTAWRRRLGWTQRQAGERLDLSRRTVQLYEAGEQRIPRTVELACAAFLLSADPIAEIARQIPPEDSRNG